MEILSVYWFIKVSEEDSAVKTVDSVTCFLKVK
jgi:hypothetical protein